MEVFDLDSSVYIQNPMGLSMPMRVIESQPQKLRVEAATGKVLAITEALPGRFIGEIEDADLPPVTVVAIHRQKPLSGSEGFRPNNTKGL